MNKAPTEEEFEMMPIGTTYWQYCYGRPPHFEKYKKIHCDNPIVNSGVKLLSVYRVKGYTHDYPSKTNF